MAGTIYVVLGAAFFLGGAWFFWRAEQKHALSEKRYAQAEALCQRTLDAVEAEVVRHAVRERAGRPTP
jgi:hypothetical protein